MRNTTVMMLVALALIAGCATGQPVFEDRSDEVRIKHRSPSK